MQILHQRFVHLRRGRAALAAAVAVAATAVATIGGGADARERRGGDRNTGAAPVRATSILDFDRLGPIRIGMTLAQARRASGQPLRYVASTASPRCGWAELEPRSFGAALGIGNGVVEVIQLSRPTMRVRGGARIGDSLRALRRLYGERLRRDHPNPYVRTLTRGKYRVVFSVDGRYPVSVITAGRRPAIDWSSLCT